MTYPPQGDNAGQSSFGQDSFGDTQQPYGQARQPYGQAQQPYGQDPYGQEPFGQGGYGSQATGPHAAGAQAASYTGFGGSIDMRPRRPGPPSNVGWAVASIIFFWPLAFTAMTRALDVYPLWAAGRHEEAEAASATAKKLGIAALVVAAVILVMYFVFLSAIIGMATSLSGY